MVRVLGVDPGSRSFDLVVVEDGVVVWEKSIDTSVVAENPSSLLEAIHEANRVDIVAAPSGYGVPPTFSEDIVDPWRFAVEILLLSSWDEIVEGVKRGDPGALVYKALAETVVKLIEARDLRAVFIPGVVHLPTLRAGAKINRIDLGTADKLSVTVLAVYQYARSDPSRANFMVLEMGYGYNALMVVEKGKITWGWGGTVLGTGMLTAGPLDLEVVVMGNTWRRSDVFRGGVMEACGTIDPEEAVSKAYSGNALCKEAYESMIEAIATTIAGVYSRKGIDKVVVSGRLASIERLVKDIASRLPSSVEIEPLPLLEGAKKTKHAAHGYALVADGLVGGVAKKVVDHMEIPKACGTVLDKVIHPRLANARERLLRAYTESVKTPKLCS